MDAIRVANAPALGETGIDAGRVRTKNAGRIKPSMELSDEAFECNGLRI